MKLRLSLGAYLEAHHISADRVVRESQGRPVQLADLLEVGEEAALDAETREWQEAELMAPLEPYDWEEAGESEGLKVKYVAGQGFVVERT